MSVERYQVINWETGAGPRADSVFGGGRLRWGSSLHPSVSAGCEMEAQLARRSPPAEWDGCVCGSHPAASFHHHARHPRRLSANACRLVGFCFCFFAYS